MWNVWSILQSGRHKHCLISWLSMVLQLNSSWCPPKICKYLYMLLFHMLRYIPSVPFSQNLSSRALSEKFALLAAAELFSKTFHHHHHPWPHATALLCIVPDSCSPSFTLSSWESISFSSFLRKEAWKGKVFKSLLIFQDFILDNKRK